jgi:aldehyde dehydrogenase (NAD+)
MGMQQIIEKQRAYFATGATMNVQGRIQMLKRLQQAIRDHEVRLCEALKADLGKSRSEAYMCEIGLTLSEIAYHIKHLKKWTKPRKYATDWTNFHAKSYSIWEPYGCVLVMSPWNYPFLLSIEPLIGAISAGNCCVLKPSAYTPNVSHAMKEMIADVFEESYVAVVEGGRNENSALLEQRFDYIFFTGGVEVGKLVMEKAAKTLTPVTLELGGKSPCIVDKTCDLKLAAKKIAFGKFLNCGQTCVAPDYVFVDATVKEAFLEHLKTQTREMFGEHPLENPNYGKIVNNRHFHRLLGLIQEEKRFFGGESDEEACRIAPTVLVDVTEEDPIMLEEIFGPVLPIMTYHNVNEVFDSIHRREKPLAAYLFTRDANLERRFLEEVSFGGGCINDTVVHLASTEMGFGGVGGSGMGSYHGHKSFLTFSHEKSILKKYEWIDLPMRYQPYSEKKDRIVRFFLK